MSLTYQNMKRAVKIVIAAGNVPNIVGDAGIGKSALVAEMQKNYMHACSPRWLVWQKKGI